MLAVNKSSALLRGLPQNAGSFLQGTVQLFSVAHAASGLLTLIQGLDPATLNCTLAGRV